MRYSSSVNLSGKEFGALASADANIDEGARCVNLAPEARLRDSVTMETERDESLVTVARFQHPFQADGAKMVLEQAGIRAFLADANFASINYGHSMSYGGVRVQVQAEEAERAKEILDEFQQGYEESQEGKEGASCPHCGCASYKVRPKFRWWAVSLAVLAFSILLFMQLAGAGILFGFFFLPLAVGFRRECRECGEMW